MRICNLPSSGYAIRSSFRWLVIQLRYRNFGEIFFFLWLSIENLKIMLIWATFDRRLLKTSFGKVVGLLLFFRFVHIQVVWKCYVETNFVYIDKIRRIRNSYSLSSQSQWKFEAYFNIGVNKYIPKSIYSIWIFGTSPIIKLAKDSIKAVIFPQGLFKLFVKLLLIMVVWKKQPLSEVNNSLKFGSMIQLIEYAGDNEDINGGS